MSIRKRFASATLTATALAITFGLATPGAEAGQDISPKIGAASLSQSAATFDGNVLLALAAHPDETGIGTRNAIIGTASLPRATQRESRFFESQLVSSVTTVGLGAKPE